MSSSEICDQPAKKRKLEERPLIDLKNTPPGEDCGCEPECDCGDTTMPSIEKNGSSVINGSAHQNGSSEDGSAKLNEDLYSRQLYTLGRSAMLELRKSKVLISGMRGLGVEIAKNVILAGVKQVAIHDTGSAEMADLSSQYYLSELDIGKNRAKSCWEKLAELNPEVNVQCLEMPLTTELVKDFNVVVLTESNLEEVRKIGDFCHSKKIRFILARTAGLFGKIFCDFGEGFEVNDTNGEEPLSVIIENISHDADGEVACLDELRHGFEDGDWVTFKEVEGMTEINDKEFQVQVTSPYKFKIGDTSKFSPYTTKGIALQVKKPKIFNFKSYSESVKDPEILIVDFAKFTTPRQLHFAFQALDKFVASSKRLPLPRNAADAKKLFALCKEIAGEGEEFDEKFIDTFSFTCAGDVAPMNGVIGGIAAQEVIKAITGKYMPINQWFYFDSVESLPEDQSALTEKECAPQNTRYDGQIKVFGAKTQSDFSKLNSFIVGAGAIGCEHLKNFSLMGVSCGSGKMLITDMDTIETSNLNRQFLFRKEDVKSEKSATAAKAAKSFNSQLNIESKFEKVCAETESIFGDDFFDSLDFVANALDNIAAREYMDRRCVYYRKPLLESGTLGSKGNTQVVIPFLTESYSTTRDPPENSYPICTLKNFPYEITHTLQWAREEFETMFATPFSAAAQLSEIAGDSAKVDDHFATLKKSPASQCRETLVQLQTVLRERPANFEDCVLWARNQWLDRFHNQIAQLLFAFPPDRTTSSGALFWSPPKRCPKPLDIDVTWQYCIEYITAAALLRAENFNIRSEEQVWMSKAKANSTMDEVRNILAKLPPAPQFKPKEGVRIAENDSQLSQMDQESEGEIDNLIEDVRKMLKSQMGKSSQLNLKPIDFEKDDDRNWHIDYITAASNCRATNYSIELADKLKSKQIAGKIIPAIATTTALISGLVCLELYKIVNKCNNIERYKCAFVNLALPYFGFSEPLPPPKNKYNEVEWTLWDRFDLNHKDLPTVKHLIDHFQTKHNMEVQMISYGVSMLYSFFMPPAKQKTRQGQSIKAVIEEISKAELPKHVKYVVLELCVEQDGEDLDLPYIKYQVR